jgi:hypothetical protein
MDDPCPVILLIFEISAELGIMISTNCMRSGALPHAEDRNADRRRRVMAGKVGQMMPIHTGELADSRRVAAQQISL